MSPDVAQVSFNKFLGSGQPWPRGPKHLLTAVDMEMVLPQASQQAVTCNCSSMQLVLILRSNLILLNIFQETDTCYLMMKTDGK